MAVPPDRPDTPPSGRRISRWVLRVLLLTVAMLAVATPAFAAGHAAHDTRSALNYRTGLVSRVTGGESRRGYGEHRHREQQHPENPAGDAAAG